MGLAAASPGDLDPVADRYALDRLDGEKRRAELCVEPPIPMHMASDAWG